MAHSSPTSSRRFSSARASSLGSRSAAFACFRQMRADCSSRRAHLVSNNMAPILFMHLSACSYTYASEAKRPQTTVLRPSLRLFA